MPACSHARLILRQQTSSLVTWLDEQRLAEKLDRLQRLEAAAEEELAAVDGVGATIAASGAISSYETVVLLSAAEVDSAMKTSVAYQPPGS